MEHLSTVVLESALAILSGGVDKQENPIVTFPPDCADLIEVYSSGEILKLLKQYVTITGTAVSIVADLKEGWTDECIVKFTSLLDGLQTWQKGSLHTAYLIKPCVHTKNRMLQRHLSKLHSYGRTVTSYKVIRLEAQNELYNYVDKSQLTSEYGGTLHHNHGAWIKYQKKYYSIVKMTENHISKFPIIKKELENLRENVGASPFITDNLETTTRTQYEMILQKFCVHETIKKCEGTLNILGHPEGHTDLVNVHPAVIEITSTKLLKLHEEITQEIDRLDKFVFKEKHDHERLKKIETCRSNSAEVVETIELLSQQMVDLPNIGNTVVEAQTNRNAFIADVLKPSKDIIDCASSILQNLSTDKDTTPSSYKASFEIARQLQEALQPFTAHVNALNETYTRIHMFYVIYNKVVRWKEKATTFIDLHLSPLLETALSDHNNAEQYNFVKYSNLKKYLSYDNNNNSNGLLKDIKIKAPGAWDILMDHFRYKHPPPKRKHLRLITKNVSDFIDKPHLVDAETLAERTMFILAFFSRKYFKGEDIVIILKWRNVNGNMECADNIDIIDEMNKSDLVVTTV